MPFYYLIRDFGLLGVAALLLFVAHQASDEDAKKLFQGLAIVCASAWVGLFLYISVLGF